MTKEIDGFVYIWRDKSNNKLYIGSHKGLPDSNYIGSGVDFMEAYNKNPNNFERIAIQFSNDCRKLELTMLRMLNVEDKDRYYNKINGLRGFYKGHKFGYTKGHSGYWNGKKRSKEFCEMTRKRMTENNPRHWKGVCGGDHPSSKRVIHIKSGKVFDSLKEAAADYGCTPSCISKHIHGQVNNQRWKTI